MKLSKFRFVTVGLLLFSLIFEVTLCYDWSSYNFSHRRAKNLYILISKPDLYKKLGWHNKYLGGYLSNIIKDIEDDKVKAEVCEEVGVEFGKHGGWSWDEKWNKVLEEDMETEFFKIANAETKGELQKKWNERNKSANQKAMGSKLLEELEHALTQRKWGKALKYVIQAESFNPRLDKIKGNFEISEPNDLNMLVKKLNELQEKGGVLVYFAGQNGSLPFDLKLMEALLKSKITVYFVVKDKPFRDEVSIGDVNNLLERREFENLKNNDKFNVIAIPARIGLNLKELVRNDGLINVLQQANLIILKGQENMTTSELFNFDHFVIGMVKNDRGYYYTGFDKGKGYVAFIPPGMPVTSRAYDSEPTEQDLKLFIQARQAIEKGGGNVEDYLEKLLDHEGSFLALFVEDKECQKELTKWSHGEAKSALKKIREYLNQNPDASLAEAIENWAKENGKEIIAPTIFEVNMAFNRETVEGIEQAFHAIFELGERRTVNAQQPKQLRGIDSFLHSEAEDMVVVDGLLLNMNEFKFNPYVHKDPKKPLIKPNDRVFLNYVSGNLNAQECIVLNFLYYWPQGLQNGFNKLAKKYKFELPDKVKGQYLGFFRLGKDEYVPLMNKGAIGYKDGKLIFGRLRIGEGKMSFNGNEIKWIPFDFDPKEINVGSKAIAITPLISENNKYYTIINPYGNKGVLLVPAKYREDLDLSKRYNLVLYGNKVVKIYEPRSSDTFVLPPPCWILSIPKEEFEEKFRELGVGSEVELENELPEEWKKADWIFGGGMILLGKDLTPNLIDEMNKDNPDINKIVDCLKEEVMQAEGWDTYISRDSQATDPAIVEGFFARTPRQIIGITNDGKFFVFSFSGRITRNSGVSYAEALLIIKELLGNEWENVSYIMSLDDGGSVNLGFIQNRKYYLLNLTSPGIGASSGDIRECNSYLIVNLKP